MTEQHAIYAPSSAHRWTHCTASAEAISRLPDFDHLYGNGENADGTAAHSEIERCLGLCDGESSLDLVEPVNPAHPAAYGVALVLDYVRQLPPGICWVEKRVRLTDQIWGRCDIGHWDAANLIVTILDYKNGYIDVQAKKNEQLRIYGAATILTRQLPAKWVRYAVVQPNSFMPGGPVKQWIEPAAALYQWANDIAKIPASPRTFTAGEHCRYCPLFGQCPATRDVIAHLAIMMADRADQVPAHQVATFLACKKPIEDWFKSLEKHALATALKTGAPAGMSLVTTQPHRTWQDPIAARAEIFAQKGIAALDPPTPAQAKKMGLSFSGPLTVIKPEGGPALALESDPRPKWQPKTVAKMFEKVTK